MLKLDEKETSRKADVGCCAALVLCIRLLSGSACSAYDKNTDVTALCKG